MVIRVLIADDHSVVREGLRMFLQRDPDLAVVGEAANGAEAIELSRQLRPDVVLMDLLMPVMDGIAATQAIRSSLPETQVLALTSVLESAAVVGAQVGWRFFGVRRRPGRPATCSRTRKPPNCGERLRRLRPGRSNLLPRLRPT